MKNEVKIIEIQPNPVAQIRAHTIELYEGYKAFVLMFGNYNDPHYLIKLISELEGQFLEN